jgi:hypothetical protein
VVGTLNAGANLASSDKALLRTRDGYDSVSGLEVIPIRSGTDAFMIFLGHFYGDHQVQDIRKAGFSETFLQIVQTAMRLDCIWISTGDEMGCIEYLPHSED